MAEFKWADVAHYHLQSGIEGELNWGPNAKNQPRNPLRAKFGTGTLEGMQSGKLVFTPILRHRDDMTEEEAAEFHQIVRGHEYFLSRHEFENGESAAKNCLVWAKKFCKSGYFMPAEFHYLISKGFDVFGLIEAGEAIRKEVGNG